MSATTGGGRLEEAASQLETFGVGKELTSRISVLEAAVGQLSAEQVSAVLDSEGLDVELLDAARQVKRIAGQINVVIHAVGIMVSLPHILESGEIVDSVSLGAGNTGRDHDLETNQRIAEFKFIDWQGGSETIRQNNVFADVFNLAVTETAKRKILYVLGTDHPLRFLRGGRALSSVLGRAPKVRRLFHETYGEGAYTTVGEYWEEVREQVELVDLRESVPAFRQADRPGGPTPLIRGRA
jgi:hypothetical protein